MTDFDRHVTPSTSASTGSINDTIIQAVRIRRILSENTARLTGAGIDCVRLFRVQCGTESMADWMLAVDPAPGRHVSGLWAAGWYSLLRMILDGLEPALRLDVSPSAWLQGADAVALERNGIVVFAAADDGDADHLEALRTIADEGRSAVARGDYDRLRSSDEISHLVQEISDEAAADVAAESDVARVRIDLDDAKAAVIRAALACAEMSVLQALRWYDEQAILGYGKTPAELVAEGRLDAVMKHLRRGRP